MLTADVSEHSIGSIFIGRSMKYDRCWDVWGYLYRTGLMYITYSSILVTYIHLLTWKNVDPNYVHIFYRVQLYLELECLYDYVF